MSQEILSSAKIEHSPSSDGTRFATDDEIYLRESKLASIEQARANLAVALEAGAVTPAATPEAVVDDAEAKQLSAIRLVYWEGSQLEDFRGAYDDDTFDLKRDEALTQDMFDLTA